MALSSGSRLGPYDILSPLGAGGFGEVYKARDTRLDRTVAIKILPSADPALKARFEREAKAIACLTHPHICTLYDVGHHEGTDYLVMEYLEGETLDKKIARGPIKIDEALKTLLARTRSPAWWPRRSGCARRRMGTRGASRTSRFLTCRERISSCIKRVVCASRTSSTSTSPTSMPASR